MTASPPRPMCFVAMPFGRKSAPDDPALVVEFDQVWRALERALAGAGYEPHRADFETSGGFVHRAMYERLLVAELVVADVSFGNPNVAYEVGVRHGAGRARTILIGARRSLARPQGLPFDYRPLRVVTYDTEEDGSLPEAAAAALGDALVKRIAGERAGIMPNDNPILQVSGMAASASPSHEKTDVFMERMQYVNALARRISEVVSRKGGEDELDTIQAELTADRAYEEVPQLHTNLLALFLAWRAKKRYDRMEALFQKFPPELKRTPVALEQLALARNRRAEAAAGSGDAATADQLRASALAAVKEIPEDRWSSETWGIVGRIHKGAYDAAADGLDKKAALQEAIDAYESGFKADPRDYYPGVNAVTLRAVRNEPEDQERLARLMPAVQFSMERAPTPRADDAYWQGATQLELACLGRDWRLAEKALLKVLGMKSQPWMQSWMFETSAANLEKLRAARAAEPEAVKALDPIVAKLRAAKA